MEAGEVLRACRGKIDQAIDFPSGLGEPRPQRVDRILLRAIRFEPLAQALAQHLAIEDVLEPLLDAVEDGGVEIGHRHAKPIADAAPRGHIPSAHVVRILTTAHGAMRLKLLAAVLAGDHAAEQVGPVPWPAHAEAPRLMLGLGGVPELRRDDCGERSRDDDVLRHSALDLATSLADLRVAGLGVDERAAVDRVAEDRPDGGLGPGWAPLAAQRGRRGNTPLIESVGDGREAPASAHVAGEDVSNDLGLEGIDHERDSLAFGLPPSRFKDAHGAVGLGGGPPIAVGWRASGPVAPLGMGAEPAGHHLRELLRILVGEDPLEALHEMPRDSRLVGARLMGVDHPHPSAPEGVFVEAGFFGVQTREPADVVAEHDVSLAKARLGADLQEREEVAAACGIQAARVVGELANDAEAICPCPRADGVALLFDREILIRTRTAIQRVSRGHLVCPSAGGCRRR